MGVANTGTSSTRVFPEGSEIVHITLDRLAENMVRRVRQNPSTTKPTLDRTAVHGSGTAVISNAKKAKLGLPRSGGVPSGQQKSSPASAQNVANPS